MIKLLNPKSFENKRFQNKINHLLKNFYSKFSKSEKNKIENIVTFVSKHGKVIPRLKVKCEPFSYFLLKTRELHAINDEISFFQLFIQRPKIEIEKNNSCQLKLFTFRTTTKEKIIVI